LSKPKVRAIILSSWRQYFFSGSESGATASHPTKRALDAGDSAAFSSIFLHPNRILLLELFLSPPQRPVTQTVSQYL